MFCDVLGIASFAGLFSSAKARQKSVFERVVLDAPYLEKQGRMDNSMLQYFYLGEYGYDIYDNDNSNAVEIEKSSCTIYSYAACRENTAEIDELPYRSQK